MTKNKSNRFSPPIPLEVSLFEKQSDRIPDKPGVYRITADEAACCGKWAEGIPRWLGVDEDRILAIGKTGKSLKTRIKQFWQCDKRPDGHSEGNLLLLVKKRAKGCGSYPKPLSIASHLMVSWQECADPDQIEKDEIWCYVVKHGEVPPLNSALPGRKAQLESLKNCSS